MREVVFLKMYENNSVSCTEWICFHLA